MMSGFRERRINRLKREIVVLENMNDGLWRNAMLGAILIIGILFIILFAFGLHMSRYGWSDWMIAVASLFISWSLWWFLKHTFFPNLVLVFAFLIVVIFSVFAILSGESVSVPDVNINPSRVERRRAKCAAVLAKRRVQLELLESAP
jgi:hypothetical protein